MRKNIVDLCLENIKTNNKREAKKNNLSLLLYGGLRLCGQSPLFNKQKSFVSVCVIHTIKEKIIIITTHTLH